MRKNGRDTVIARLYHRSRNRADVRDARRSLSAMVSTLRVFPADTLPMEMSFSLRRENQNSISRKLRLRELLLQTCWMFLSVGHEREIDNACRSYIFV